MPNVPPTSPCPLCGCQRATPRFSERGHQLVQCEQCELFFLDPYPVGSDATHETVATYDYQDLEIVDPRRHYQSSIRYYERYFPRLEPELAGAHRVLDIGCGTGRLLELLSKRPGLECEGIELNRQRAAFSRSVAGCPIHEVPIEQFQSSTPYDVVFMMNVLSHVAQFAPFFTAVRRLLHDRSRLVLKVGEMTGTVKKSAVHEWSLPDHLHFLGIKSMDVLAARFGFEIARHDRDPLSCELFAKQAWLAPGRSRLRNALKRTVASVPLALPLLRTIYDTIHGGTIYTSLVVLTPA
jgi:SAM-dependent methyltransferase